MIMKFSYPHPKLPAEKAWLSGKREGAPILLDPYMHVWGHKKIKKYYNLKLDYTDGYWLYRDNMAEFKLNIGLFGYAVLDHFLNKKNFSNYLKQWDIVKKRTVKLWDDFPIIKIKKISDKDLIDLIATCQELLIDIWGTSPLAAMIGDIATDWTNWWMNNKGLSEEKKKQAFLLLFFTNKKTETIKRQEAIKKLFSKKGIDKKRVISLIIEKYGYAKSNFGGFHQYTEEDILQDIDAIKKTKITDHTLQKKNLLKKLKATSVEKRIFDIFGYCQYSRDERMAYEQQLFAIVDWSVMEISKRFNIPHQLLKYMLVGEVSLKNLRSKKYINLLKKRHKGFLMYWKGGKKGRYVIDDDANKIFDSIDKTNIEDVKELKGQSAFYGHVTGRVKIIMNPKAEKPKKPFILVTSMTSPDFIHFLHKCVAIITDEGGITCHAAILSRELKKPCIIGTKIATKVLKDGDLVEVDANRGIVKILKKSA